MDVKGEGNPYAHVLKYTSLFGGVQGLSILMSLVKNKIVAVILGPSGMGLVSLFNSSVNMISQLTNLGISFSAVKNISEAYDSGDEGRLQDTIKIIRGWSFLVALIGMAVCVAVGPALSDFTFAWGDHTLHFVLLSPAVALLALSGGETAILKGTRRLRQLARIQAVTIFATLLIALPVYLAFGEAGIVPVIVLSALSALLVTVFYSFRLYPVDMRGAVKLLGEGMQMVRLGVAYILAGIMGSVAEMVIRSFLNVSGDICMVGYYNAGYVMTITYAGMVFSAMETDFFPRLSAVNQDNAAVRRTVNRQIEVSVLLLAPLLALFIVVLPLLLPLLYSGEFVGVSAMAQVAVFSMYIKAMSLPMAYVNLAKGNSIAFFVVEASYYVFLVLFVVIGFRHLGLTGTGIALSAAHLVELVMIYMYNRMKYGYRLSRAAAVYGFVQTAIGGAVYATTFIDGIALRYVCGIALLAVSVALSVSVLRKDLSEPDA